MMYLVKGSWELMGEGLIRGGITHRLSDSIVKLVPWIKRMPSALTMPRWSKSLTLLEKFVNPLGRSAARVQLGENFVGVLAQLWRS